MEISKAPVATSGRTLPDFAPKPEELIPRKLMTPQLLVRALSRLLHNNAHGTPNPGLRMILRAADTGAYYAIDWRFALCGDNLVYSLSRLPDDQPQYSEPLKLGDYAWLQDLNEIKLSN